MNDIDKNFEYLIEQINKPLDINYNIQDIHLNSKNMNESFSTLEKSLNTLYENTRYLEDAIFYCNTFLNLKISEYSKSIQEQLKGIEDIREVNKSSAYIEYICSFKDDLSTKKDRDNKVISNSYLKENSLFLGIKHNNDIEYDHIRKQSSYVPYYNNINTIKNEEYRTFYIEEKIANKGVVETITITLKEPIEINYVNIKPVNAEIENLRLVYINGIEEYIDPKNGLINNSIVTQIKFDLVNKKYNTSTYYMDKNKLTDDVWNKIKEYEYTRIFNIDSKIEMNDVIARASNGETEIYETNISNKDNIIEKQMYSYIFGIESIEIKNIKQENDSCFVSESINVGKLSDEYIQLHVEDMIDENCVVEYSILDGDMEIPILPFNTTIIKNERLFPAQPLRFNQDHSLAYTIKKDGMTVDISLDDAKLQLLNRFSIDYFPEKKYNYTPINSNIKIKAVIRKYNNSINNSYIRTLKIRKYGGDVL